MSNDHDVKQFFARCEELIKERQEIYARPEINLERIARSWGIYLGTKVSAYDVCLMMVMLKLDRLCNGYHQDGLEDAAAYLALASSLSETRVED